MKKYLIPGLVLCILYASCVISTTDKSDKIIKGGSVSSDEAGGLTGALIKNNIELEVKNVKILKAYLMTEDRNYKDDNNANINEKVILTIVTDTGWVKENGKSFIGASERVTDSEGNVILDADDLFMNKNNEGLDAQIAKTLNLTANITQKSPNGSNDYIVSFRMWDKKGQGEIKGKYKLHIN